jgi:predicted RNase H-like nuclease (RuvC/YqgF family)
MADLRVAGIDIKSGSPRSSRKPLYSISILGEGGVLFEAEEVTLDDVLELLRKYDVNILATDNVFEIASDSSDLRRVMEKLPPKCKLIQVTGSPNGIRPLSSVAKEAGLPSPSHSDPLGTARIVANLAMLGVGTEAVAMYPETRILVTRNRSVKQGGSGSDRWRRSIEASILSEANRIATELDKANLDYDLYVERASGGLRRAEFIVYADPEEVRRVIKESSEWSPFRIILSHSWKSKVKFPGEQFSTLPKSRPLIVGIDPGMSVGLAIMDLNGEVLSLKTMRRASRSEIIEEILNHGYPVIIATDVNPPPKSVVRIANMFDSRLIVAKYDMKAEEKRKIVMEFEEKKGVRAESSHERDSLAAALKAYQKAKNLIAKARARIEEAGLGKDADLILSKILKGTPISVALEEFSSKEVGRESKYFELRKELARADNYVKRLIMKIRELREEIERYKEIIRRKDEEISDLRRRIEYLEEMKNLEIEIDRRISARDSRIRELEKELERERWQNELLRSQLKAISERSEIPGIKIKVLSSLAKEKIDSMTESAEAILALDASGASSSVVKKLKGMGVKIILYKGSPPPPDFMKRASEEGIFVDSEENYRIAWNGVTPVIPMDEALKLLARSEEVKESQKRMEFDILGLIENYRLLLMRRDEKGETSELLQ